MPKTNTELIQELTKTVAEQSATISHIERATRLLQDASEEQADSTGEQVHQLRLELRVFAERDARREREVSELRAVADKEREERTRLQLENAALKQQLQDHIKYAELWDGRLWALVAVILAAMFSLASGLIIMLVKK